MDSPSLDSLHSQLPTQPDDSWDENFCGPPPFELEPHDVEVVIRKHSCGHSWCSQGCGVRKPDFREAVAVLASWDWTRTREIIVSCDPKLFPSPQEGYSACERSISDLIRDLNRKIDKLGTGLLIVDYVSFTEFHRNGYPHFHIMVLVSLAGRDGMIGKSNIADCWRHGSIVWEQPFRSKHHRDTVCGYMGKTGYFAADKAHQVKLPQWAMDSGQKIRRIRKSRGAEETAQGLKEMGRGRRYKLQVGEPLTDKERENYGALEILDGPKNYVKPPQLNEDTFTRTNSSILATCGRSIQLYTSNVLHNPKPGEWGLERRWLDKLLPYDKAKKLPGFHYVKHRGLVCAMYSDEWHRFYDSLPNVPGQGFNL